ncbi:hypothetical protein ACTNEF_06950 [Bariatricus sp. HCP28S3_E4]|uniref:hypothetical protein n=1 Tax=unclassified Bariatricus TaxID=2677046 RepID=UPI003F88CF27
MSELGRELDWDDSIEKDSDYVLLPEGDYEFVVESVERARHPGSDKLPPCNKAIVKMRIDSQYGTALIIHNLFLHTNMEGMLSAFFTAIGQKKKGEKLKMNWGSVPGSTGRAHVKPKQYNGNEYNDIKKFYPKEEKQFKAGEF